MCAQVRVFGTVTCLVSWKLKITLWLLPMMHLLRVWCWTGGTYDAFQAVMVGFLEACLFRHTHLHANPHNPHSALREHGADGNAAMASRVRNHVMSAWRDVQ